MGHEESNPPSRPSPEHPERGDYGGALDSLEPMGTELHTAEVQNPDETGKPRSQGDGSFKPPPRMGIRLDGTDLLANLPHGFRVRTPNDVGDRYSSRTWLNHSRDINVMKDNKPAS